MLTLADVSKAYGTRTLFEGVSLFVKRDDRLGLVGPNGAGKTTLFHLILGEDAPDSGSITWQKGADFGYLPQETAPAGDETVLQLAKGAPPDAEEHGDFSLETKAKIVLTGLGFRERDFDRPARTFSGGWIMRAHLARLLVSEPALLLLDEPTNHLDLHALLWFQDYLSRYPGGLVVISHDRAFLNTLCTGILELRNRTLYRWTGNYDDYLRQKEAHHAQQITLHKNQQREIAHLQRFVDRFGAKASLASRAKSKEKQIERLRQDAVDAPEEDIRRVQFRFPQPPRSGLKVVTLTGVEQAYGNHVVYRDLNFAAERGQRVVLVGPNGAGKSTLLKILAGVVPIQAGTRELGGNVQSGYFAQNRLENLDAKRTVLEEALDVRHLNPEVTERMARTILGGFLFRKDDVFKKVGVLSGGEKSRLALAKLLLAPPNLLLMDEPTTHLDMASIDALINALRQYSGTLLFISHDVHFIRQVAQRVVHVDAGRLTPYAGDFDYYLEKSKAGEGRAGVEAASPPLSSHPRRESPPPSGPRSGPKSKEQRRQEAEARAARSAPLRAARARVAQLETEITHLEQRQSELTAALEAPETYNEPGKPQALNRELAHLVDRLAAATADWESESRKVARLEA
ncbi:MAG TPA: ABC-F family ATP-binding cassette domain-containing protein [Opitutaceae bacterium]|jgi:ATP-binding cassette subfamily F protein 3|nr:ABC-F family ATP-binding cassette domain-containing protein [Opitutaceae bacterium]